MGKLGININDEPENFKLPQIPPRNPPPTTEYVGQQAVCKGSLALGSGCGRCSRCKQEIKSLLEEDVESSNTQSKVFYNMQALLDYVLIFKLKHFDVRTKMGGVVLTYQKENH